MRFLDYKYYKLNDLINNSPKSNLSGNLISYALDVTSKTDHNQLTLNIEDFKNVKLQEFEGNYFYVPIEYDRILTTIYGNYNKLPPIEERKPSHGWTNPIDF